MTKKWSQRHIIDEKDKEVISGLTRPKKLLVHKLPRFGHMLWGQPASPSACSAKASSRYTVHKYITSGLQCMAQISRLKCWPSCLRTSLVHAPTATTSLPAVILVPLLVTTSTWANPHSNVHQIPLEIQTHPGIGKFWHFWLDFASMYSSMSKFSSYVNPVLVLDDVMIAHKNSKQVLHPAWWSLR